jgi:excisionase family DNA binding protein
MQLSNYTQDTPAPTMFDRYTLYNRQEVAERLRICVRSLHDLLAAGKIRYVRIGRQVRIPGADLLEFIRNSYEDPERIA